jgi:hypothetical protein
MGDGLHVDDRDVGVLGEGVEDDVLSILLPVLELGEGADPDQIAVAGQHLDRLLDVLLGVAQHHGPFLELERPHATRRGEDHGMPAQLVGPHVERGACPQGVVEEEEGDRLPCQVVAQRRLLQCPGVVEHRLKLGP